MSSNRRFDTAIMASGGRRKDRKSLRSRFASLWSHKPSEVVRPAAAAQNIDLEDRDNPHGLNPLYEPTNPLMDFVFVHGLRGGSRKTWCMDANPENFWPKTWLHLEPDLKHVRTSSFGYRCDWTSTKPSPNGIYDFARNLFTDLCSSSYLGREARTPIVLIGHSMGGLVIKQAYLLAVNQNHVIAQRMKCMVFLATPHRGSDPASIASTLIGWARADKQYVEDLERNSNSLKGINDSFSGVANSRSLMIHSMYETEEMGPRPFARLIVPEDSAVLGYPGESVSCADANHRNICKFTTQEDRSYVALKNILGAIAQSLIRDATVVENERKATQMQEIRKLLHLRDGLERDFQQQLARKIPKSCEWIESRTEFQEWRGGNPTSNSKLPTTHTVLASSSPTQDSKCKVYWLTAKPGAGKSVCAAHVVSHLRSMNLDCAYYFFRSGDQLKQSLCHMLLSIAYQMADRHPGIRMSLLEAQNAGLACGDEIADNIWNEIFVKLIFKSDISHRMQYWVLDALDECKADARRDLVKFLASIPGNFHLRVFVTSRPGIEPRHHFDKFQIADQLKLEPIMPADTQRDMRFYLDAHIDGFFISDPERRSTLQDKLLAKANDCFLWLNLVRQELEQTYSNNSIAEVLDEIPAEMSDLYQRCFHTLSKTLKRHDLLLSQTLFTWAACAIRPLKLEELLSAIGLEPLTSGLDMKGLTSDELGHKIPGLCGYLLYVDHNNNIQFCHSTVRDFLLSQRPESNYAIESSAGHQKLLIGCLTCMAREMKRHEPRSVEESRNPLKHKRSAFASYASIAFSDHLAASSSKSPDVLEAIFKFLCDNVHSWIEHVVSEQNSLDYLIRTAKNLRNYLERLKKHAPPLSIHFRTVEQWSTDLVRLVAKFGANLKRYPGTIHTLIPSIAPKDSHLHQQMQNRSKSVEMFGPAGQSWNDCAAVIPSGEIRVTALTCGRQLFVVGHKDGTITLYDHATCEQKRIFKHPQGGRLSRKPSETGDIRPNPVKLLSLNGTDTLLASACLQNIYLWSLDGELLQNFHVNEPCVLLTFSLDGKDLIAVTRSSCIHRLDVLGKTTDSSTVGGKINPSAINTSSQGFTLPRQAPLTAAISPDQSMLALLYRGRPIHLCSLEDDPSIRLCGRDANSRSSNISVQTALFNPNQDVHLLAVSYQDGELALYDTLTLEELINVSGDAYTLASTPDGQTLGTGDTRGTISLWDFETLTLLYQIRSGLDEIRTLAFTGDNSRLVDLRDSKLNVWEPSALVRKSVLEDASMSDALPLEAPIVGENEEIITLTAMCPDTNGEFVFAGRSDGSVAGYRTSTGLLHAAIFIHSGDLFVSAIAFKNGVIATADAGGRVLVHKLQGSGKEPSFLPELMLDIKQSEPIQRIVISEDGSKILLATASRAVTWNLGTRLQGTYNLDCSAGSIQNWTWATDAANLTVVVNSNTLPELVTYDWKSFEITHSAPLAEFPQRKVEGSTLTANETICETWDRYMVVYNSNSATLKTRSDMVVYDRLAARPQDTPQTPIFKLSADAFLTLIGIYSHNLVFLDRELWVCSISLNEIARSKSIPHVTHHFFIPSDLLSGPTGLRPILSPLGHVVFAKEDQLAVIKGLP